MDSLASVQSREKFLSVVDELRAALGYALRNSDPEFCDELVMEMMYGNFDFSVVHSLLCRTDKVLIECQFGEIPENRKSKIIERLLQMNTTLAELDGSVFCLESDGTRIIYALPMQLSELDGYRLLSKMTEIVWHGRRWLETNYIEENKHESNELINPIYLA